MPTFKALLFFVFFFYFRFSAISIQSLNTKTGGGIDGPAGDHSVACRLQAVFVVAYGEVIPPSDLTYKTIQ